MQGSLHYPLPLYALIRLILYVLIRLILQKASATVEGKDFWDALTYLTLGMLI